MADADAEAFYVTIGAAHEVAINGWSYSAGRVRARSVVVNTSQALSLAGLGAAAAALQDDDPTTVDVIALPKSVLRGGSLPQTATLGMGFDDSRAGSPLYNVLFVGELNEEDVIPGGFRVFSAVDAYDDFPFVVGHELGHVLAGDGHPNEGAGAFGLVSGHPLVLRHLMATTGGGFGLGSPEADFVGGPKRMNESFVGLARSSPAAQLRDAPSAEARLASPAVVRDTPFPRLAPPLNR